MTYFMQSKVRSAAISFFCRGDCYPRILFSPLAQWFAAAGMSVLFFLAGIDRSNAQDIKTIVGGNLHESSWVLIDGVIEAGASSRLEQHLERYYISKGAQPPNVVLNSPGGSLFEGMLIGLLIREMGLSTSIGEQTDFFRGASDPEIEWGWVSSGDAICASACAYAFLGGADRYMTKGQNIGFHQFFNDKGDTLLKQRLLVDESSSSAQIVTGLIVEYLGELGDVSFLILSEAARALKNEMNWVSRERAIELGVIRDELFDDFYLEAYGEGVVAASRATVSRTGYDTTRTYYRVAQATFFCRGRKKLLMLSSSESGDLNILDRPIEWSFKGNIDDKEMAESSNSASVRSIDGRTYIDIDVGNLSQDIISSHGFSVSVPLPRSQGGSFTFEKSLSDTEKKSIAASFRLCI
jgi:hypothetical protein